MIKFTSFGKTALAVTMLFASCLISAQIIPDSNGIVYVKPTATGTGAGNSWANATSSLRTAITTTGVSKVYAAVGYYHVQGGGIVSMKNGVEIYGGFIPVNDETDWTTRFLPNKQVGNYGDWWGLEGSIIDGMNWNGGADESIVINNSNLNNTAVLDGFSVIGGNGYSSGGGIINNNASPTLRNLVISTCSGIRGGAIYNNNSSPVVTDVIISANYANETLSGTAGEGGGVHNRGNSSPVFTNTLFINNNAVIDYKGGAVYHTGTGTATFINCTFNNNTSGVNNPPSVMRFNSVTVEGGSVSFINSIVFGTVYGTYTAQNSMIQGHTDTSDGNINADPYAQDDIFISPTTGIVAHLGNYGLKNDAAVLNAGSNALFPGLNANSTDIKGNARVLKYNNSGIIDMGAYENQYVPLVPTNGIVYVKPAATGEMDGSSWDNATSDLYSAVLATGVSKVFVAVGNHNLSDHSVVMKSGVEIYGGFEPENGIEDLDDTRILPNPNSNVSGSILNGQNARPVIYNDNNGADNTALLDGFTLTNGKYGTGAGVYNNGASPTLKNLWIKGNRATSDGGGMFNLNSSSPVMTNITIENNTANYAGGVFNRNNSSPVMTNVFIKNNTANNDGGGMYNDVSASPVMTNVSITGNTSQNGAGIYNRNNCSPILTNVLIANNTAATNGGAIRNENNSSPNLTNVTIANNVGSTTLYATDGSTSLANSIVYGTVSASYAPQYSLIQGNTGFTNGNIDAASYSLTDIFNDNANGDYSLKNGAVVVNEGNNALNTTETDLAGNPRIIGTNIDFGAYELFSLSPDADNILYVNQNATGNGTGNSWVNAVPQLADALKYARGQYIADNTVYDATPLKIYVAKGTYKPLYGISASTYTTDQTRDNAFTMVKNVQIYGGFDPDNGIDDLTDTRIFGTGGSILSGELGITPPAANSEYDNAYHVVVSSNAVGSALLDGFTIRDAYSQSTNVFITVNTYPVYRAFGAIYTVRSSPSFTNCIITANLTYTGGGMYNYQQASPTLTNCSFIDNHTSNQGGAIYNNTSASPVITNCSFTANWAVDGGGAIYNSTNSSPVITNCSFTENNGGNAEGGAIYNYASSPIITNALFANNSAGNTYVGYGNGGAIYNEGASSPSLTNVTIANNTGLNAVYADAGSISIANSIIFGTISGTYTPQYSLIEGNTDFTNGNINPSGSTVTNTFTDATNGNYTLKSGTSAINAGNNALNATTTDLAGNARIRELIIDLGAYESPYNNQIIPDANGIVYVKEETFGNGSGSSWSNATSNLQNAIDGTNVQKVFVAVGNYPVGSSSYVMKNDVAIYGGFDPDNGISTLTDNRILPTEAVAGSVLDGLNTRPLIWNDNNGLTNSALLDGFTLMKGKGDIAGAIYNRLVAPVYNNLVIRNNEATTSGGGIYNLNAPIKLTNALIANNTAQYGGGVRNNGSNAEFTNVIIKNNTATLATGGAGGGGIFNENSDLKLTNVLIADNSTERWGGGFRNLSGNPVFTNVTLVNNTAVNQPATAAMEIVAGTPEINNSIVFGTTDEFTGTYTPQYSLIQDNTDFTNGNIDASNYSLTDIFNDPSNGDYTLKSSSVAINAGNNTLFTDLDENTLDLAGNPRLFGSVIDLGAYELQSLPSVCSASTTWNGTTWSNGEPDSGTKAVINGDLTLTADLESCELEVTENGSLTISDGFTFTVNGKITNNAGEDNFIVRSGGNLIQTENYETDDNEGKITVERESNPILRLDYAFWSSPVKGQQLQAFSPMTLPNRIYTYETNSTNQTTGGAYEAVGDANSDFIQGKGYLFRAPNNWIPETSETGDAYPGQFVGEPSNGNISIPAYAGGYTSIGNPYPSNIDPYKLLSTNSGTSALYFWNNPDRVYDEDTETWGYAPGSHYVNYTGMGYSDPAYDNRNISVGQGFIVYTTGNSVNFDNSMRDSGEEAFFKTEEIERHRFWLSLDNAGENKYNQILIGYMTGATNEVDEQIDGELFGYEGSAIFNLINDASAGSATRFSIQGRALPFETGDVVPLGFRATEDAAPAGGQGKFRISLTATDGLFSEGNTIIYLKDKFLHTIHNLMESGYEFESPQGEFNNRFEIVYGDDGTMGTDDLASNEIQIYKDNDFIVVKSKSDKILSVELFDLNGRNIYRNDNVNSNLYKVKSAAKGVLIVRAKAQNGEIVTKKVINN